MNPVLRKALSAVVIVVGVLPFAVLAAYWHEHAAVETTIDLARLHHEYERHPLVVMAWVALFGGIFLYPPEKKGWSRACFALALVVEMIAFATSSVFAFFGIVALPAFVVAVWRPELRAGCFLVGNLLPAALYVFATMFLHASTRSFVSRVKADMRSMATAIEAYYVDHNAYPPSTTTGPYACWQSQEGTPTFWQQNNIGGLTTPVAYLTSYPGDPIRKLTDHRTFAYYCSGPMWILISPGPNSRFEIPPDKLNTWLSMPKQPADELMALQYDPTNGMYSAGDIWRLKQ